MAEVGGLGGSARLLSGHRVCARSKLLALRGIDPLLAEWVVFVVGEVEAVADHLDGLVVQEPVGELRVAELLGAVAAVAQELQQVACVVVAEDLGHR